MDIDCELCGVSYLSELRGDVHLHNRVHRQWPEVAAYAGVPVELANWETYEHRKSETRNIFGDMGRPLDERVHAAREYLRVQYAREVWNAVRHNTHRRYMGHYPSFRAWLPAGIAMYEHEFTRELADTLSTGASF